MNRYNVLYDEISDGILKAKYPPGMPLPSIRVLAERYRITVETVRQALKRLKLEGKIISVHGVGNFVAEEQDLQRNIMILGPLNGHYYSDLLHAFTAEIKRHQWYNVVAENIDFADSKLNVNMVAERIEPVQKRIDEMLLRKNLAGIFFNGQNCSVYNFLSRYVGKVPIYCFDSEEQLAALPVPAVTVDYFHAGFIGIQHLCQEGCRQIIVDTFHVANYYSHRTNEFHRGCETAAKQYGAKLISFEASFIPKEERDLLRLKNLIRKNPRVDGMFSFGDYRIMVYQHVLKDAGLIPGKNVALLGFYDTPWCKASNPPLSSIHINIEEIARLTVKMFFDGDKRNEQLIRIPPELIIRESSRLS